MQQPGSSLRRSSSLREILDHPGWPEINHEIDKRREWLDRVHVELTEIPAPTFLESERAAYMADRFRELGLERVAIDSAGNVLGERPGSDQSFIAITAHLDTVLQPGVAVEVKRSEGRLHAPGISDNGAGLAALLVMAAALQDRKLVTESSLLFIATVGEEGEGDLCGMRHLFAQREFSRRAKGVVVIDGASIHRTAVAALGSRRFLIEVSGPGGHSWNDFGRVNPIHVLADTIERLKHIPLPAEPRTSLNISVIHGGTVVNAIPTSAWLKLDIRSTDAAQIATLSGQVESAVREAAEAENRRGAGVIEARIAPVGERPAAQLPPSARILSVVREVDEYLGIRGRFEVSSTDANIPLSLGIEAITTGGGGTGGDTHTPNEWYDPRGRETGLKRLLLITLMLAGVSDDPVA